MKKELVSLLACPECKLDLTLYDPQYEEKEIKEGRLQCHNSHSYKVHNFIPRFVSSDEYVSNFSFEWNVHRTTQLDVNGKNISQRVFINKTGFSLAEIKGKLILDVGVGTGRFADIVEKAGGEIIGIDLSYAVDAAFKNIGFRENVHIIQANVFNLPLKEKSFDYIYSIGVLHHTPNCEKAFKQLPQFLKPKGKIAIWVYNAHNWPPGSIKETVNSIWRKITTRLPKRFLYAICHIVVINYYVGKIIPFYSLLFHMLLPGFIYHIVPGSNKNKDLRVRVLDTFDWYSPVYQSKHTYPEVFKWFKDSSLKEIEILDVPVSIKGVKQ